MSTTTAPKRIYIGSAFYPEHWSESRWLEDIILMKNAGFTVARIAEFAWSSLEPQAGVFEFGWLERAIKLLADNDIAVVLGTPTAAPPAWLVYSDPSILAIDESGRKVQFGNRCHYCVNSLEFHLAVGRVVGTMAERFGSNPNVIGWQIDNEYNRVCYCETCQKRFQEFLANRYGTLENLNIRWSTRYWSQTYSSWDQIPIPIGPHNPGLMLEFQHFVSDSYRNFQKIQLDLIRPHISSDVWITHNFMGWFGGFDHYELNQELDITSWDWYVGPGHHDYLATGAIHDLTRGFKRTNFWLMETQPLNVNWKPINNTLYKGETSVMAWHAIAHGADAVLYWQWRSALGGQEQYHGTLVDQSGKPRPFYYEAAKLAAQINQVSGLLVGSKVISKVALLNSYDSRWSIEFQRHHNQFDYVEHFTHYYAAISRKNVSIDIISSELDLDGYELIFAPALILQNSQQVERFTKFVENGGNLVLTIRTGMKDQYNALLSQRQPGELSKLAGIEVEEYFALDEQAPVVSSIFSGYTQLWAEVLKILDPENTTALAHFGVSNGWLDGEVAITEYVFGKGKVFTVGAYLDAAAQQLLINYILESAKIETIQSPSSVEIATRRREDGSPVFIVINHSGEPVNVSLPWLGEDHLSDQVTKQLFLPPFGVAVLTEHNRKW